jgi:hypothetical protein
MGDLLYRAGLTAQGCWDELGAYEQEAIEKLVELTVQECISCSTWVGKVNTNPVEPIHTAHAIAKRIKTHFGIKP